MTGDFDEALYEVLERSKYNRLTGRTLDIRGMTENAIRRFIEFIVNRFNIRMPDGSGVNADVVAAIFAAAGALVLAWAVFFIIRRVKRKRNIMQNDLNGVFDEMAARNLHANDWLKLSQSYYIAGALREAVRYRYIAGLAVLNEKKVIRIKTSVTNAQIARDLNAAAPFLTASFNILTDCFHRCWFGYKNISDGEFNTFSSAVEDLFR
jgi:tetrahydromethanopterin S-methyltransferase subunit H